MKFHVIAISSDICADDPEEGEGESTGCGYNNEPIGKTFDDLPSIISHLSTTYGLSANEVDYDRTASFLRTSKSVADHSQAQNGGWFDPTPEEFEAWRLGRMKLYSENFHIRYFAYN